MLTFTSSGSVSDHLVLHPSLETGNFIIKVRLYYLPSPVHTVEPSINSNNIIIILVSAGATTIIIIIIYLKNFPIHYQGYDHAINVFVEQWPFVYRTLTPTRFFSRKQNMFT